MSSPVSSEPSRKTARIERAENIRRLQLWFHGHQGTPLDYFLECSDIEFERLCHVWALLEQKKQVVRKLSNGMEEIIETK
jgi:hypothetical protein